MCCGSFEITYGFSGGACNRRGRGARDWSPARDPAPTQGVARKRAGVTGAVAPGKLGARKHGLGDEVSCHIA